LRLAQGSRVTVNQVLAANQVRAELDVGAGLGLSAGLSAPIWIVCRMLLGSFI
jgi:hypothetical protein